MGPDVHVALRMKNFAKHQRFHIFVVNMMMQDPLFTGHLKDTDIIFDCRQGEINVISQCVSH